MSPVMARAMLPRQASVRKREGKIGEASSRISPAQLLLHQQLKMDVGMLASLEKKG